MPSQAPLPTVLFLLPSPVPTLAFASFFWTFFPYLWLDTAPFTLLSCDATGKSLTRWRLALAQEAARGTFLLSRFLCGIFSFLCLR